MKKKVIDTIQKISLRKHIGYARVEIKGFNNFSYILYNPEKQYIFNMARNKKLNIIWKDESLFALIDFTENKKGNIIHYLNDKDDIKSQDKIEGNIVKLNIKQEYNGKKLMLITSKVLDNKSPYIYEPFCFYTDFSVRKNF